MFNLFKKVIKDESLLEQKADLLKFPEQFSKICLEGEVCDEVKGANGSFGLMASNPIPVNGPIGEIKYIGRLRTKNNSALLFHRIGSVTIGAIANPIDVFETVSFDGKSWDILYFHPYHPRRSVKIPKGYSFSPFHDIHSRLPVGFGTTKLDAVFPFGLGKFIKQDYDIFGDGVFGNKLAENYENLISQGQDLKRPLEHIKKLELVSKQLNNTSYFQIKTY
ncbi:MAG: hypothetical protein V4519_01225 [Patescibacteria group bacterium]